MHLACSTYFSRNLFGKAAIVWPMHHEIHVGYHSLLVLNNFGLKIVEANRVHVFPEGQSAHFVIVVLLIGSTCTP